MTQDVDTSLSVEHTAEVLDCALKTVRNLLNRGELEGFYLGRTMRVFKYSITNYQIDHRIITHAERRKRRGVQSAAHREAVKLLRNLERG